MKVLFNLESLGAAVVTVGTFDGVHSGHREVLGRAVLRAHEMGLKSVVVTFSPHPREVLGRGVELLTPLDEKIALIERTGVDYIIVMEFTPALARLTGAEFIDLLRSKIDIRLLVAGFDNRLGSDRVAPSELDLPVEIVPQKGNISSTLLRRLKAEKLSSRTK